ncbi:MAG: glycosyltransferase family 4 protein [Bacteroidota bacterium]
MKIVFVLEHYYPYVGGAEKLFQQLAESLATGEHDVTVVTTRFDGELPKKEQLNGVKIRRVNCYNRYLFTLFSLPQLWANCRNADIIHTTTYNAAFPAWLIGKIYRKRVVLTFHELWSDLWFQLPFLARWQRWVYYLYESFILKLSFDHYLAVSEATAQDLRAQDIPTNKIVQIYNGIDYQQFRAYTHTPPPKFTLLYFGRLGVSKGLDLLLPAWGAFLQDYPDAVLQLVIPLYPRSLFLRVSDIVQQCIPKENIQYFHDLPEDDLFTKISQVSAVVIPSYSEGFCFAAAETVAIGTPVISSGKKALQEVVSGKHITIQGQEVDDLLTAIKSAYQEEWDYSPVRKFDLKETVDAYLAFYRRLT